MRKKISGEPEIKKKIGLARPAPRASREKKEVIKPPFGVLCPTGAGAGHLLIHQWPTESIVNYWRFAVTATVRFHDKGSLLFCVELTGEMLSP